MPENKSTRSSTKHDMVNSPKHYRMQGVEAIDILEMSMTEEEFIYWAGYYEIKAEEEKKALQRQKRNSR